MLGNLRDLNWPERAKNTSLPPQAASVFPIHLARSVANRFYST